MTALLTNEYTPFSLAVIGFAGGVACACDFSCPSRAPGTAINAANAKQSFLFTRSSRRNHATSRSRVGDRASALEARNPRSRGLCVSCFLCRSDVSQLADPAMSKLLIETHIGEKNEAGTMCPRSPTLRA